MKSITRKLSLLLLLSATLFMSSCLDSGENSYIGNDEYSFVAQSDLGRVYARTAAGYLITSEKISLLTPGSTVLLTYQIDDATEKIKLDENTSIYKVMLGKEPITIGQEPLQLQSAPEEATPLYFESIIAPPVWITQSSVFFGDRWPFTYQYKAKKGETVRVHFYQVPKEELPENFNADILIDIRMEKTGTPEVDAHEELKNDIVVANMSALRNASSNINGQEAKQLSVKFRFYRIDSIDRLHISQTPVIITVKG